MTYLQHRRRIRLLCGNRVDDARIGDLVNMCLAQLWSESWSFRKQQATLTTVIDQALYTLPANVDLALSLAYWRRFAEWTVEESDRVDAQRDTSGTPYRFLYRGQDATGAVRIELWPIPSSIIAIPYSYLSKAPVLVPGTDDAVEILMPDDVLDYCVAYEGLTAYATEHFELPGIQVLIGLAKDRYAQYQKALAEALYTDLKVAGPATAIRDVEGELALDGDFAVTHDTGW